MGSCFFKISLILLRQYHLFGGYRATVAQEGVEIRSRIENASLYGLQPQRMQSKMGFP